MTALIDELGSAQGRQRVFAERGTQLAVIVLLVALAIDAALILTDQLGSAAAPAPAPAPAPTLRGAVLRGTVNPTEQLTRIVNAHLFGAAGVHATGTDAPQTTMPLILAGVIADRDPSKGEAIIGQSPTATKLYAVGGNIPGGVRLQSVYADRVLLERNGAIEALMLPHTASAAAAQSSAPGTAARKNLNDASQLFGGLVRVQPVFSQGKLNGYRIFPGGRNGITAFGQLGLVSGDLITAVNGTALDDQTRSMEVLQTLGSASTASVTVMRNNTAREVSLNLSSLTMDDSSDAANGSSDQQPAQSGGVQSRGNRINGPTNPNAPTGGPAPSDAATPLNRQ